MTTSQFPSEFESNGARYEVGRLLGRGNAGAVYLALDRDTGEQIALKRLFRIDTKSVLRLKREFRALANLHHPNLVKLYDLGRTGDSWFLTMEYVDGSDLLSYLDPDSDRSATRSGRPSSELAIPLARIINAFSQLACGVQALHRAGMLHRDLKPSNVLVAQERVVALDFGLVRELDEADVLVTQDGAISGTPAYMPPEQALGNKLSEVSDWYAVGVMLYQALSGRLPIDGNNANDLLKRKLEREPAPLSELQPLVPARLSELCTRLLRQDPEQRAGGDELLDVLTAVTVARTVQAPANAHGELTLRTELEPRTLSAPLFGRDRELAQLTAALDEAHRGTAHVVHVRGASGAGKSALVERFLEQITTADGPRALAPLVLRSRCYEREAMPFKALDGVMDALVRHLARLDDFDVAHLLPADLAELAQLFPAFDRLRAVQRLLAGAKPRADALAARQRAQLALRDLFARLAANHLVVLWIDDLQWGDLDSATLLESWLRHVADASLLVLFSYRSEEMSTSSCLHALLARGLDGASFLARELTLELEPLAETDVWLLCEDRLSEDAAEHPELIARIVQEARGNPFLASQLSALADVKLARHDQDLSELSIGELVEQSTALLPPEARAVLSVLAIAGRPLTPQLALRAAGIQREGSAHLHALKSLRLMRMRDVSGERRVEVYHDRVREGVQATLDAAERRAIAARLLRTLEQGVGAQVDADWLYTLSLAAGERQSALRYGLVAAERAGAALAFERAAELYRSCIELSGPAAVSGELWLKLALALTRCKLGTQAANAYLEAAKYADAKQIVSLTRLAASHLLRTGHFERAEPLVERVLGMLQITVPKSEGGLLAAIGWERMRLSMTGDRYTPRSEAELPRELVEQCDVYATLAVDMLGYDPLLAELFQTRSMRYALAAGDPTSLVRAWCVRATSRCVTGSDRDTRQAEELLTRAAALCEQLGRRRLQRHVHAARAICDFMSARPADAVRHAEEAERMYRDDMEADVQAEYYQQFAVMAARLCALLVLGEFRRVLPDLEPYLDRARATDNRSIMQHLAVVQVVADQLRGQPELSRPRLDEQRTQLPRKRFGLLHIMHTVAVMSAACATSDHAWARAVVDPMWNEFLRSPIHGRSHLVMLAHAMHARLLLNQHVVDAHPRTADLAALIHDDLRVLEKGGAQAFAAASIKRLRARLANLGGQREQAVHLFRESSAGFEAAGSRDEACRDQYALGCLLNDGEGMRLRAAAEKSLSERGVVHPRRELHGYFPELVAADA